MKAAVASGIILCLILALVIFNGIGIRRTVATMADMVAALPDTPGEEALPQIAAILDFLSRQETYLSFSVPYSLLDRGVELCKALEVHAREGSLYDYAVTKTALADAVQDMGRLERLHLKNIF